MHDFQQKRQTTFMKMKVVLFYQKFIIFLLCLGIGVCFLSANYGFETHHSASNLIAANNTFPSLRDIFKNFFPIR